MAWRGKLIANCFLFALWGFTAGAASLCAAPPAAEAPATPALDREQDRRAGPLLNAFRTTRIDARRLRIVQDLAKIGPAAVARLAPIIEREIAAAAQVAAEPDDTAKLAEPLAALRKTMADLRNDADLTKEKLTEVGDPAMQQLTQVYNAWWNVVQARDQKLAAARQQLQQTREFLLVLAESKLELPDGALKFLPVSDELASIDAALDKLKSSPEVAEIERVAAANAETLKTLPEDAGSGMLALNQLRQMLGLRPLLVDPKLCAAAEGHSADMARLGFFSHESPVEGKKKFTDRAEKAGTTAASENIYKGSTSARTAILGWFHSPGHHQNMFGDHQRQGLGHVDGHWTQNFGE